jgi:hypothetical protein
LVKRLLAADLVHDFNILDGEVGEVGQTLGARCEAVALIGRGSAAWPMGSGNWILVTIAGEH